MLLSYTLINDIYIATLFRLQSYNIFFNLKIQYSCIPAPPSSTVDVTTVRTGGSHSELCAVRSAALLVIQWLRWLRCSLWRLAVVRFD